MTTKKRTEVLAEDRWDVEALYPSLENWNLAFDKMAQNVLEVINQLDQQIRRDTPGKLIGHEEEIFHHEIAKELLTSKRHIEIILKNISEGVLELTPEGQIVYANTFAIYLTGLAEEDLLGLNFTELFSDADRELVQKILDSMGSLPASISKDPPVEINNRQVSINILPVHERDKRSFVVIVNNISELVRLKTQLREARKMLEK